MKAFLVLVAVLGLLALGVVLAKLYSSVMAHWFGRHGVTTKTFMTPNEVDFYRRLCAAAEPRWVVLPQVAMAALMNTRLKPLHPGYWNARTLFAQKVCDFVLCDPKTMAPQLVVELDDVSHNFNKDRLRDTVVARAGYRTVRFWSRKKPNVAELRAEIDRALALNNRA